MPDDLTPPEKITLIEKPEAKPTPVCTVFNDCSIRVDGKGIGLIELQRLLLGAAVQVMDRTVQRAVAMEGALIRVHTRFDGLDEETDAAIRQVLGAPP
jgi:hypothetical protein